MLNVTFLMFVTVKLWDMSHMLLISVERRFYEVLGAIMGVIIVISTSS